MSSVPSPTRRALLFGRPAAVALRPPWAKPEPEFDDACTRCDACIRQCPSQVLVRDGRGLPRFQPSAGECTFCRNCVTACRSEAFDARRDPPWTLVARVADACLSAHGVVCASCRDICPTSAVRVPPGARGAAVIVADRCTGCAACVSVCPVDAIAVQPALTEVTA